MGFQQGASALEKIGFGLPVDSAEPMVQPVRPITARSFEFMGTVKALWSACPALEPGLLGWVASRTGRNRGKAGPRSAVSLLESVQARLVVGADID